MTSQAQGEPGPVSCRLQISRSTHPYLSVCGTAHSEDAQGGLPLFELANGFFLLFLGEQCDNPPPFSYPDRDLACDCKPYRKYGRVVGCERRSPCLDEVGIFKSEEIEPALSIQRDRGVPIILAFQNFAQLEENYGVPRKRSILSNPGTKIILHVDGQEALEAQDLISAGAEVERLRESKSAHWWQRDRHHTYSTERPTMKPVPAGVIQTLQPGAGFLVQPGRITPLPTELSGFETKAARLGAARVARLCAADSDSDRKGRREAEAFLSQSLYAQSITAKTVNIS